MDLEITTKKQPSAVANPANHCGAGIGKLGTKGLVILAGRLVASTVENPSEAVVTYNLVSTLTNFEGRPLFINPLIASIFKSPSLVKCSLFRTKFTACLNKR